MGREAERGFDPVSYAMGKAAGGGVPVPTPVLDTLTATENDTYTPEAPAVGFDSVIVDVPVGYTGRETITGTLANPWGSYTFAEIAARMVAEFSAIGSLPILRIDATAISFGVVWNPVIIVNESNQISWSGAEINSDSHYVALRAEWNATGLTLAKMATDGTITDLVPYASVITTTLYLPT